MTSVIQNEAVPQYYHHYYNYTMFSTELINVLRFVFVPRHAVGCLVPINYILIHTIGVFLATSSLFKTETIGISNGTLLAGRPWNG